MRDPLLTAAAVGVVSMVAGAIAKFVGRRLLRLLQGAIRLVHEFRAFLVWRAQGGQGPPAQAGPGAEQ